MKTATWTITSSHICEALREKLEFWLYGPHATDPSQQPIVPTEQHVDEFANALFERRECKLFEAEVVAVRRWVCVQAMKRAISRRRWRLTCQNDVSRWQLVDRLLHLSDSQGEGGISFLDLLYGDHGLLGEALYRGSISHESWPSSAKDLLEAIIEIQTTLLLKGLTDYADGKLPERFLFYWESTVAEVVALEMLEKLPGAVSGAWKIQSSLVKDLPSPTILERLEEAYQCFQYGLYQACLALCRAILEYSLKERLQELRIAPRLDYRRREGELEALIRQAEEEKILSPRLAQSAQEVHKMGNNVLHRRDAATSELCWSTLEKVRYILARLYK